MVLRKIKNIYQNEIDELPYTEHGRLISLRWTENREEYEGHNGAAWFTMMEEGTPKFRDELTHGNLVSKYMTWVLNLLTKVKI